jgi:O-antigen/teichoic acid export membrane protein
MTASASSSKRHILTNASANLVGFALQAVVVFVMSPLLIHGLGDRRYGIWSLVESVLGYLTLFDLGISASVVYYVSKYEACSQHTSLNRLLSTSLALFAGAGLVIMTICLVLAFSGARPLGVPVDLVTDVRWLILLLGANLALELTLGTYAAVLTGLGRYPAKTAIQTAGLLLWAVLVWGVLRLDGGLPGLAVAITFTNLVQYLAFVAAARYYLPQLQFSPRLVDRETFWTIRGYSFYALVALVAGRISFQTDALVIGSFLSFEQITFFVVAARLIAYAKDAIRMLTIVLTPAVSTFDARGNQQAIRRVLLDGSRYVLYLVLPIELGFLLLGRPFLSLWLGHEYAEQSYATLAILALPLALALTQSVSGRILYGMGRLRWLAGATLLEAVANLLLSLALVQPFGIEGVAWGTTLPNLVFHLAFAVHMCRTLGIRTSAYLRRTFLTPLVLALVPFAIWLGAIHRFAAMDWLLLMAVGATGLVCYGFLAVMVELGPQAVIHHLKLLAGRPVDEPIRDGSGPARRQTPAE